MAEIVLSEEETQAMVDRVLDQVEKALIQRLETDLYRSVIRSVSDKVNARVRDKLIDWVENHYTEENLDKLLARAMKEHEYGSLQYALRRIVEESRLEFKDKIFDQLVQQMKEGK